MTSGMSLVRTETTVSGVDIALLTGTLAQWKAAVVSGTSAAAPATVRTCYSKVLLLFDRVGLTSVWSDHDRRANPCGFLLEHNRYAH